MWNGKLRAWRGEERVEASRARVVSRSREKVREEERAAGAKNGEERGGKGSGVEEEQGCGRGGE